MTTFAVEALARTEPTRIREAKSSVWEIIMLTDDRRFAVRYAERHNMDGGVPLRVVGVSMSRDQQASCCPFLVEVSPRDKYPTRFRYEPEAQAHASRFLNSLTRRSE